MKILVDILHPGHVHFFRNAIALWKKKHDVLVTSRKKEMTLQLLDSFGIEHTCLSTQQSGITGLLKELIIRDFNLYKVANKFNPHVLTGIAGVSIAHIGRLIGKPSIIFYDTETATLSNTITYPFASAICTPECYEKDIGEKQVRYAGYHELAYLHPRRFAPKREVLDEVGIGDKRFFILRFVSWQASHDIKKQRISPEDKLNLVKTLTGYGQVFVTSEAQLPADLQPYQLQISPEKIHHIMAFASLVIGEGATMISEAAMLGIPAVYITKPGKGLGYTNELEKRYELVFNFTASQYPLALQKVKELLQKPNLQEEWQEKRDNMLKDKIDVTDFITKFVEKYPIDKEEAKKLPQLIKA